MIPKTIFAIWLNDDPKIPDLIQGCLDSQKIPGYEHKLITLDNCFKDCKYMQECLNSPYPKQKWCKASDYLRMHYLLTEGGIYLDADVEVLPGKNFDALLDLSMFVGKEQNGWVGSAVIGAEKDLPFIKEWKEEVEAKFRGDDNKNFESSMEILTKKFFLKPPNNSGLFSREYFYPYDHQTNTITLTDNSITYHKFYKSWV